MGRTSTAAVASGSKNVSVPAVSPRINFTRTSGLPAVINTSRPYSSRTIGIPTGSFPSNTNSVSGNKRIVTPADNVIVGPNVGSANNRSFKPNVWPAVTRCHSPPPCPAPCPAGNRRSKSCSETIRPSRSAPEPPFGVDDGGAPVGDSRSGTARRRLHCRDDRVGRRGSDNRPWSWRRPGRRRLRIVGRRGRTRAVPAGSGRGYRRRRQHGRISRRRCGGRMIRRGSRTQRGGRLHGVTSVGGRRRHRRRSGRQRIRRQWIGLRWIR